jgi:hypothetical protein
LRQQLTDFGYPRCILVFVTVRATLPDRVVSQTLTWFRLTNHIVGGVGVGPGFDGWLFPDEPRRRRELVNPICWEVLQAREYEAEIFAHRNLQSAAGFNDRDNSGYHE